MTRNAASWDRVLRALGGVAMMVGGVLAPLPLPVRALAFGGVGLYLVGTALVGSCLGYRLMGISTCPISPKGNAT